GNKRKSRTLLLASLTKEASHYLNLERVYFSFF
ncbi:MAG: hypothetical protein ACI97X_002080, partial [Oceanospirillaceae bacterium]